MTNLFETLRAGLAALSSAVLSAKMPHEIDLVHPPQHPFAGLPAGKLLLRINERGAGYEAAPFMVRPTLIDAVETLSSRTDFRALDSALMYLRDHEHNNGAEIFVDAKDGAEALVTAYLDATRPKIGVVHAVVRRHPTWCRIADVFIDASDEPMGWAELSHEELADLLLENTDFLVHPELALIVARFSGARRVSYEANLETERTQGVRIEWRGASVDAKGEPVQLPREIEMNIPAHVGAWEPGREPLINARFALRVLGREDAAPVFKLCWTNRAEHEMAARKALEGGVVHMVDQTWTAPNHSRKPQVYMAAPDIRRVATGRSTP